MVQVSGLMWNQCVSFLIQVGFMSQIRLELESNSHNIPAQSDNSL